MPQTTLISLRAFPQLRQIAWSLTGDEQIEAHHAFALYERLWRFVDVSQLEGSERALIEQLCADFGPSVISRALRV
jgi:hypothetical protein